MLSGVVAATWGRGRSDMSYESVVLHGDDHGTAAVVLPVPRLRAIYTVSDSGMYAVAFAAVSSIPSVIRSIGRLSESHEMISQELIT